MLNYTQSDKIFFKYFFIADHEGKFYTFYIMESRDRKDDASRGAQESRLRPSINVRHRRKAGGSKTPAKKISRAVGCD